MSYLSSSIINLSVALGVPVDRVVTVEVAAKEASVGRVALVEV